MQYLVAAIAALLWAPSLVPAQQSLSQDELLRGAGSKAYTMHHRPDSIIPALEATLRDPTIPPGSNQFLVAKAALAVAYATDGQYQRSAMLLHSTLGNFESRQDIGAVAFVHQWLSFDYRKLEDFDKAVLHARRAARLYEKAKQPIGQSDALAALGNALVKQAIYDSAYASFTKSADVARANNYGPGVARGLSSAAHILLQWQQYAEAIAHYQVALEHARESSDEPPAFYLNNLAGAYLAIGDTLQARLNAQAALDSIGLEPERTLLMNIYSNLAKVSMANGNYFQAAVARDTLSKLSIEAINKQHDSKLAEVEANYKAMLQLKADALEQAESLRKESEAAQADDQRNIIIGFSITLLIIIGLSYFTYRYKQRGDKLAAEQRNRVELMQKLMEDKVKERTASLTQVNEELDNLLYRSSHDLRAPINQVLALTNLLEAESNPQEQRRLAHLIHQSMDSLDRLNLSICEAENIRSHTTKLANITLQEFIPPLLEELGIVKVKPRFQPTAGLEIGADAYLLKLALSEIIRNSVEAAHGAEVDLSFVATPGKGFVDLRISDNGPGVPKEIHTKLFDLFSKGHSRPGHHGLGLYKARLAVQKMGGTLELEQSTQGGATFRLSLPFSIFS